jgi:hypothetical protein
VSKVAHATERVNSIKDFKSPPGLQRVNCISTMNTALKVHWKCCFPIHVLQRWWQMTASANEGSMSLPTTHRGLCSANEWLGSIWLLMQLVPEGKSWRLTGAACSRQGHCCYFCKYWLQWNIMYPTCPQPTGSWAEMIQVRSMFQTVLTLDGTAGPCYSRIICQLPIASVWELIDWLGRVVKFTCKSWVLQNFMHVL